MVPTPLNAEPGSARLDVGRAPVEHRLDGAVLVLDVGGFTQLTERLSRDGPPGVERLRGVMTAFFSDLVALVTEAGGAVLGYEGDALIAGWAGTSPVESIGRCAGCALAMMRRNDGRRFQGEALSIRGAIGVGPIRLLHLGETGGRRFFAPAGRAMLDAAALLVRAEHGETLVTDAACALLPDDWRLAPHGGGARRLLDAPTRAQARPAPHAVISAPLAAPGQRPYLPQALLSGLDRAPPGWIGEFRLATVVAARIAEPGEGETDLATLNDMALAVHHDFQRLGGEALQLRVEGDGLSAFGVFGLPGEAQGDSPVRAVAAVETLRTRLVEKGMSLSAGVASGRMFCGLIGPDSHPAYTVLGQPANLAARLAAVALGRTLVDETTAGAAARDFRFSGPWMSQIAGVRRSVNTYLPEERRSAAPRSDVAGLVGRAPQLAALRGAFADVVARRGPACVLVEGDLGVGKSALLSALADDLRSDGHPVLQAVADAAQARTPYYAWRTILREGMADADAGTPVVGVSSLSDPFAPLLNDVIDLRLPETELSAGMPPAVRAQNLRALLCRLLVRRIADRPSALIVDDAHWLDPGSWRLLADIVAEGPPALVVVTRRGGGPDPEGFAALPAPQSRLTLAPLTATDAMALLRARAGAALKPDVEAAIVETSDGNPLFVEQLCQSAQAGALPVADGRSTGALPYLFEAAVLGRVDALSPGDQLVLKIASAFGLEFQSQALARLPLVAEAGVDVDAALATLGAARLVRRLAGADGRHAFQHRAIRDLVYDGLLDAQRRQGHAEIARALEADMATGGDSERAPDALAHWRAAGDATRTADLLDRVAAIRLRQGDHAGAIALLSELIGMSGSGAVQLDRDRLADAHLTLGRAYGGLSQMSAAESSFAAGLALLGAPPPKSRAALALDLARQFWRQAARQAFGAAPNLPPEDAAAAAGLRRAPAYRIAQANETLTRIHYFKGDKARLINAALTAVNFAETLPAASAMLAASYACLGAICGVIPLRAQAERHIERAQATVALFDEPRTRSEVDLLAGLYRTSVGDWPRASAHFQAGLAGAESVGDRRLWSEIAVSYELISSPWLLTGAFAGVAPWRALVERICATGRERDDSQILMSGLLARLRAPRHPDFASDDDIDAALAGVAGQIDDPGCEVEPIYRIEAAAQLARAARREGRTAEAAARLAQAEACLRGVTPGMKSRTLPALVLLFDAALDAAAAGEPGAMALARLSLRRLTRFSAIFVIGGPARLLREGDALAFAGRATAARRRWRAAGERAAALSMHLDAAVAAARLGDRDAFAAAARDEGGFDGASFDGAGAEDAARALIRETRAAARPDRRAAGARA